MEENTHLEGLLMQQRGQPVLGGDLLHHLHHHQVLVHLRRRAAVEGRELVLIRRHLAVSGAQRDANLETLVLDLLHAGHRRGGQGDGSHV